MAAQGQGGAVLEAPFRELPGTTEGGGPENKKVSPSDSTHVPLVMERFLRITAMGRSILSCKRKKFADIDTYAHNGH